MSFVRYANSFQAVTNPGLSRIRALLDALGNPQRRVRCIHVAGTNGKGSVCAFLEAILRSDHKRVGTYTSPNLRRVNERLRVDGVEIADDALTALLSAMEAPCAEVERALGEAVTQFEIWTAAAFSYFAEQGVDYVLLETGLGGRLDATNVIEENALTILTRISFDHMQYLGTTLRAIAGEKCGIMKHGGMTVTTQQSPEAMETVVAAAREADNRLIVAHAAQLLAPDGMCERFCYDGATYALSLAGVHQVENACLAIEAARVLGVDAAAVARGLSTAHHAARMEVLSRDPLTLFDGAHNENGMRALGENLARYASGAAKTFIVACMGDKDIAPALAHLRGAQHRFFFTEVLSNPRAMKAAQLCEIAGEGTCFPNVNDALRAARAIGDMIVICGSLYLYGDLDEAFLPS